MKYKTMFIDAPTVKIKYGGITYREIDGLQFSKDIEAAILEKDVEGYEFIGMQQINSQKPSSKIFSLAVTTGMMLNFKKHD